MRITKMMTMILSTGGRENFLIVRFLRDALDCIWSAVNRITVDQHDGQLHPFNHHHHHHHQHHVTFATNTFWATIWSWLGILLLTCQRGKSRNYLRRICHISGRQREMLTHCTSWQQNCYVGVKYHFILDYTLWMELWDYETSWVTQGFCWLQVYPVSLFLQFGKVFCNLRLHEILYCSSVLRPNDALHCCSQLRHGQYQWVNVIRVGGGISGFLHQGNTWYISANKYYRWRWHILQVT